jgi:hypothetical protein
MSTASPTAAPVTTIGRWPLLRHRRGLTLLVYGALVVLCLLVAYWLLFTRFADYDDEGTLLVTLKAFVGGDTLYRDIYTPYGPFYYEVWGGLFALTGTAVSTDAARLIVMCVWTATSLCFGVAAQRITGSLALGAAGMATAFAVLNSLTAEPMHPVGLVVLLLALLAVALTLTGDRRPLGAGLVAGAILAALTLTKVNTGVFAIAGCALAAAMTVPALQARAWVRWPIAVAYVLMAIVLMAGDFDQEPTRDTAFLIVTCSLALVAASWPAAARAAMPDRLAARRLLGMLVGLMSGVLVIVAVILVAGTPLGGLWQDVVVQALRQGDIFRVPLSLPPSAAEWGIAAVAGAVLAVRLRLDRPSTTPWPGLARLGTGLTIWICAAHLGPFGITPAAPVIAIPLTLAWVAALAPPGTVETFGRRFARIALPAVAVGQTLQVYPVAGTQVYAAAVTFVPVGAICLVDGWRSLEPWIEARDDATRARSMTIGGIVTIALAVTLVYAGVWRPGISAAIAYRDQPALPFAGATRLHVRPDQLALYTPLVAAIRDARCTALVGLPSTNSLYLWSFIKAPAPTLPSAWMTQLDDRLQQRVVDEVRRSPRPCAFRNSDQLGRWMNGRPTPDTPLVRYIERDFQPRSTIGNYVFLVPRRPTR